MKNWTSEGHLTDLALERRAAGEAEAHELQAIDSHLHTCPDCRGKEGAWRELFLALAKLEPLEPSPTFDAEVMARVRTPVAAVASAPAWLPRLARRLRPVAIGVAALWSSVVVGGGVWLGTQVDVPAAALIARFLNYGTELLWAAVVKIGAILQISGLADVWANVAQAVPGPGVISAVAAMTALSGVAVWTLYRVTGHQPSGIKAHV